MLRNYIKIAWRNLLKNKAFTIINLSGLTIGMTAVLLIAAWVQYQMGFERFHTHEDSLFKVYNRSTGPGEIYTWDVTSGPLGAALEKDFPEVAQSSRIYWSKDRLFSTGNTHIKAKGNDVDNAFLSMFSFPLLQGDSAHALDAVNTVVITEELAIKLFGTADVINKMVKIDNEDTYQITGVLENLPANTDFDFDYLVSLKANENLYSNNNSWSTNTFYTYVQLKPNTAVDEFNHKIKEEIKKYNAESETEIFLHPIKKWHLYSRFENGKVAGGRIETVRLVGLIGILILVIACINFMNLSTAQSRKRAGEVGVRKVIGAGRSSLMLQFIAESVLLASIAGVLAVLITIVVLPAFNQLIGSSVFINWLSPWLWLGLGVFILITGLLAGSYPAFLLSGFSPIKAFKGNFKKRGCVFNSRKVLVVTQFSVGIVLTISTVVIYNQINFVQNRDTGYDINHLIEIPLEGDIDKNFELIKNELLKNGAIEAMSKTAFGVTSEASTGSGFSWNGKSEEDEDLSFSLYRTSGDFVQTMGLNLIAGRDINLAQFPRDSTSILINEQALKKTGITEPIGKTIKRKDLTLTIAGVFEDFIIGSPYEEVKPMIVMGYKNYNYNTLLRLNPNNTTQKNLGLIEQVFKKYNPAYPFVYEFVDKSYAKKFADEKQMASLSFLFAGLAIFISCLGLFGLAANMAENRAKEMGVRKVLGASAQHVARLLASDLLKLVVISLLIASPMAYYIMQDWLQDYTYRVAIEWWIFIGTAAVLLIITMLTVSFQAIKAAWVNPVKSLRTE